MTPDLAYAAGLFEGEGHVYARINRGYPQAAVTIKMTDEEPIRRFASAVGMSHRARADKRPPSMPEHYKSTWSFSTSNFEQTQAIAAMLWKWLGPRRRGQFRQALEAVKNHPRQKGIYRGWAA